MPAHFVVFLLSERTNQLQQKLQTAHSTMEFQKSHSPASSFPLSSSISPKWERVKFLTDEAAHLRENT